MGGKKRPKPGPVIVHADECDLLREWLGDPPLDGSPLDGRGIIRKAPMPVDSLPEADRQVHRTLSGKLGEAELKRHCGRTVVGLYGLGDPCENHVFLVDDKDVIASARAVYEKQGEVIGHEVYFFVEALGRLPEGAWELDRNVTLHNLFCPGDAPDGYEVVETSDKHRAVVVRGCPYTHAPSPEQRREMREELLSWLYAYAFVNRGGLRIVQENLQAVQRRTVRVFEWLDLRVGLPDTPSVRLKHVAKCAETNEAAADALRGLNAVLSAHSDEDFLSALWSTVEGTFGRPPKTVSKHLAPWKGPIKKALRQEFGKDKGDGIWGQICQVSVENRNELIAENVAACLGCSQEEAKEAVSNVSYELGGVHHEGETVDTTELRREIPLLIRALRRFIQKACDEHHEQEEPG